MPRGLVRKLEKIIRQDDLNDILAFAHPARGSEFSRKALEYLNITVDVTGRENLPDGRRCVFVSNHPLGGLDGIAVIALLGEKYGDENIRFLVNDMLRNVKPLDEVFLPINKYGAQARSSAKIINEVYEGDKQVAIFPAGLVSRLGKEGIRDLEWKKNFAAKALESGRDIVPMLFVGENSRRFYSTARWRERLRIGVNLEQVLLPGELCASRGKHFRIIVGKPIPFGKLKESGRSPQELTQAIRRIVYSLKD